AYLAQHFPAEFFAALLSHQPMGYYPPNTLAVEARRRGVATLPLDINQSTGAFTVENGCMRIGLRQVKGMPAALAEWIPGQRSRGGAFRGFGDFWVRLQKGKLDGKSGNRSYHRRVVAHLIRSGAFDSLHPHRRQLLWRLDGFVRQGADAEAAEGLPDFSEQEKWAHEHELLGMDAHRRPFMDYFRAILEEQGFVNSRSLKEVPGGARVKVAGVVIRPHRPPTRSGKTVVFLSLEDEWGLMEITIFEQVYQKYGALLFRGRTPPLIVHGRVERRSTTESIVAHRLQWLPPLAAIRKESLPGAATGNGEQWRAMAGNGG
ncbi:MAG: OB-fold nucleic acid binding domain-containing protein, partial [Thermaerobacterales bacterium]